MSKKTITMFALCVGLAIISLVYAAYSTSLTINGTTSQSGSFSVALTGCTHSETTGLTNATGPTGSCAPSGTTTATTATCTATFRQPGDKVTCIYSVKNTGTLTAYPNGTSASCKVTGGFTTSASSSGSTPMYYTTSWAKSTINPSSTATSEFTINLFYSSSVTSQPGTTSGTVSCTISYKSV